MRFVNAFLLLIIVSIPKWVGADIVYDGSMNGTGEVLGPNYVISADKGQRIGGNLFHSFSQFSIARGEAARFTGPQEVNNIFARVTAGNPSVINGTISSNIPSADLWLMNPKGIIFGNGAKLDINGAFYATTADRIQFDDGAFASDHLSRTSLPQGQVNSITLDSDNLSSIYLSSVNVSSEGANAIYLLGNNINLQSSELDTIDIYIGGQGRVGDISITGNESVENASQIYTQDLSLKSMNTVILNSAVQNHSGLQIESGGEIIINSNESTLKSETNLIGNGGVEISATEQLTLKNTNIATVDANGVSGVRISARELLIQESAINTKTTYEQSTGDIYIIGEDILLDNSSVRVASEANGKTGNIIIEATGDLLIEGGTVHSGGASNEGGNIRISALGELDVDRGNITTDYSADRLNIGSSDSRGQELDGVGDEQLEEQISEPVGEDGEKAIEATEPEKQDVFLLQGDEEEKPINASEKIRCSNRTQTSSTDKIATFSDYHYLPFTLSNRHQSMIRECQ